MCQMHSFTHTHTHTHTQKKDRARAANTQPSRKWESKQLLSSAWCKLTRAHHSVVISVVEEASHPVVADLHSCDGVSNKKIAACKIPMHNAEKRQTRCEKKKNKSKKNKKNGSARQHGCVLSPFVHKQTHTHTHTHVRAHAQPTFCWKDSSWHLQLRCTPPAASRQHDEANKCSETKRLPKATSMAPATQMTTGS